MTYSSELGEERSGRLLHRSSWIEWVAAGPEAKGWPGEKVPLYILCFSLVGNSVVARAWSTEFRVLFELKTVQMLLLSLLLKSSNYARSVA